MQKILLFIYRHISLLIFIILETISLIILVNHNSLQQSIAFRYGTTVSAWCHNITSSITQYFALNQQNTILARQNAYLLNKNHQLQLLLQNSTPISVSDTLSPFIPPTISADITYHPARVIFNSLYHTQNYIIIDQGANHGIKPDMGVFSPLGVVGVIESVSNNYSVVLPLINPDQRISAKISLTNQLGSITWKGYNPYLIQMDEVPAHAIVNNGDSIITSGYSAIFPEGILIGTVHDAILRDNARFWKINITPAVDFARLDHVFVAAYTNIDEYHQTESSISNKR